MGARLDEQPHPHDVAQAEPPFEPVVGDGSDDPADGHGGREKAESDGVHAEALPCVEDEHRPGGPEGDIEREDREGERPHRRMRNEPADPLDHVGPDAGPLFHYLIDASNNSQFPGTPRIPTAPSGSNERSVPVARSRTVRVTTTARPPASSRARAAIWMPIPPTSCPRSSTSPVWMAARISRPSAASAPCRANAQRRARV